MEKRPSRDVGSKTQMAVEMVAYQLEVLADSRTVLDLLHTLADCRGGWARDMAILIMKYASMCRVDCRVDMAS